jgi:hypothetical protein
MARNLGTAGTCPRMLPLVLPCAYKSQRNRSMWVLLVSELLHSTLTTSRCCSCVVSGSWCSRVNPRVWHASIRPAFCDFTVPIAGLEKERREDPLCLRLLTHSKSSRVCNDVWCAALPFEMCTYPKKMVVCMIQQAELRHVNARCSPLNRNLAPIWTYNPGQPLPISCA